MIFTADICDSNEKLISDGVIKIIPPGFCSFAKKKNIAGKILTVKAFEDNSFVRSSLEQQGNGRILIVDGAGSHRCALLGGSLGKLAEKNGWEGVIVYGYIRDAHEIYNCNIGVWALGTCPKRSRKLGSGEVGKNIEIIGVRVREGDFCIADLDGILISSREI